MRNYDVLFDRTDKEIHFTKADCDRNVDDPFLNLDRAKLFMDFNKTDNSETIENETNAILSNISHLEEEEIIEKQKFNENNNETIQENPENLNSSAKINIEFNETDNFSEEKEKNETEAILSNISHLDEKEIIEEQKINESNNETQQENREELNNSAKSDMESNKNSTDNDKFLEEEGNMESVLNNISHLNEKEIEEQTESKTNISESENQKNSDNETENNEKTEVKNLNSLEKSQNENKGYLG